MGKQARERRVALGAKYEPHGHKLSRKTAARGAHIKARLALLNERFRVADLPLQSTLCAAEAQRKKLATLVAARAASVAEAGERSKKDAKKEGETTRHKADAWAGKVHRLLNATTFDKAAAEVLSQEMQDREDAGYKITAVEERAWDRLIDEIEK